MANINTFSSLELNSYNFCFWLMCCCCCCCLHCGLCGVQFHFAIGFFYFLDFTAAVVAMSLLCTLPLMCNNKLHKRCAILQQQQQIELLQVLLVNVLFCHYFCTNMFVACLLCCCCCCCLLACTATCYKTATTTTAQLLKLMLLVLILMLMLLGPRQKQHILPTTLCRQHYTLCENS